MCHNVPLMDNKQNTETTSPTDKLLSIGATLEMLGFKGHKSIYDLEKKGLLAPVYIPGSSLRRFKLSDVQKFIDSL